MSDKFQMNFASGEIDEALQRRVTLERWKNGLNTARNVAIGKTGRIVSPPGRKHLVKTKNDGEKVVIHPVPNASTPVFIEWGEDYFRVYKYDGTQIGNDVSHPSTPGSQLYDAHFMTIDEQHVVVNMGESYLARLITLNFSGTSTITKKFFGVYEGTDDIPAFVSNTSNGTGYDVNYTASVVIDGIESEVIEINTHQDSLPDSSNTNKLVYDFPLSSIPSGKPIEEFRFYRRPKDGGVFGFIGSSRDFNTTATDREASFLDIGQEADYSNQPIKYVTETFAFDPNLIIGYNAIPFQTSLHYQGRLILANGDRIYATRSNTYWNHFRDVPVTTQSGFEYKSGEQNFGKILRMVANEGLIVFTTTGVYLHTGFLSIANLAFVRKGGWVIEPTIPALSVPGGVFFIDKATNTVREFLFSDTYGTYTAEDISVYSDHLFRGKKVRSWAFQEGSLPLLWVVFTDGTYASFTYERNEKMRAWTRHDSGNNIEWVANLENGEVLFVTKFGDERHIEVTVPRYVSQDTVDSNLEWYMNESIAQMDGMVSWDGLLNGSLTGGDEFTLTPVSAGVWDGDLTLDCGTSGVFTNGSGNPGNVGSVLRYFNPDDRTFIDLEVIARSSDDEVTVLPSVEFPSAKASGFNLYETKNTFDGLDHLEGEDVSIIVDGAVVASPYNDVDNYPTVTVSSGQIDLPNERLGAIVHVGRPRVNDIQTLNLDVIGNQDIHLESKTVNKAYVKFFESRGLHVASNFPSGNSVQDMQRLSELVVDDTDENEFLTDSFIQAQTREVEIELEGDWDNNGKICIRQVDPLHFEILSITLDAEFLARGR